MPFKWSKGKEDKAYQDAIKIRKEVFMEEQGFAEEVEMDGLDDRCYHLVAYQDGEAVATLRLYELVPDDVYKVQRVAVVKKARGQGFGRQIMEEAERFGRDSLIKQLTLAAQNTAISFYEALGYQIEGEEFMEAGVPHHTMTLNL